MNNHERYLRPLAFGFLCTALGCVLLPYCMDLGVYMLLAWLAAAILVVASLAIRPH